LPEFEHNYCFSSLIVVNPKQHFDLVCISSGNRLSLYSIRQSLICDLNDCMIVLDTLVFSSYVFNLPSDVIYVFVEFEIAPSKDNLILNG